MVEPRARPAARRVASTAILRRRDMGRALAGRLRSVVAGRAGAGDSAVIEADGRPAAGGVAGRAILRRHDVRRRLAGRLYPIMARGAALRNGAMVEPRDLPVPRGVTAVAPGLRADVARGLSACAYRIVAVRADLRRAGEAAVLMTRGAAEPGMSPGQRKAGLEMVEIRTRRALTRMGERQRHEQHYHKRQYCRDPYTPPQSGFSIYPLVRSRTDVECLTIPMRGVTKNGINGRVRLPNSALVSPEFRGC